MNAFLPVDAEEVLLADVHFPLRGLVVGRIAEAKALLAFLLQLPVRVFQPGETAALLTAQKQVERAVPDRLVVVKMNFREGILGHVLQVHGPE